MALHEADDPSIYGDMSDAVAIARNCGGTGSPYCNVAGIQISSH